MNLRAYIESHPLAFEILSILRREEEISASKVARRLGRSLSTVYDSLSEMQRKSILGSEKRGVTTYFYPLDTRVLRQLLDDPVLQAAFVKATPKLRREPVFLIRVLKEILIQQLLRKFEVEKDVKVRALSGESELDFLARIYANKVYIELNRISEEKETCLKTRLYEALGRTIDIVNGLEENEKLLLVLLLPSKRLRSFDEQVRKLFQVLDKEKFSLITEHVDTVDLTNESFIQEIAGNILEEIKQG